MHIIRCWETPVIRKTIALHPDVFLPFLSVENFFIFYEEMGPLQ